MVMSVAKYLTPHNISLRLMCWSMEVSSYSDSIPIILWSALNGTKLMNLESITVDSNGGPCMYILKAVHNVYSCNSF